MGDQGRGSREKPLGMRGVGGPEHLVRGKVLRPPVQAPRDWLKGEPAVPVEQHAGPGLQAGVVQPLVVDMAIQAISPGRTPQYHTVTQESAEKHTVYLCCLGGTRRVVHAMEGSVVYLAPADNSATPAGVHTSPRRKPPEAVPMPGELGGQRR